VHGPGSVVNARVRRCGGIVGLIKRPPAPFRRRRVFYG
jgi:hypothetical protein